MAKITVLNVNGKKLQVEVDSETSLLSVLRNDLSLTGSKYGCGEGRCGACTVLVEGQPARSCVTQVGRVVGKQITTRSEEHTSELQSRLHLVCRLLLEK